MIRHNVWHIDLLNQHRGRIMKVTHPFLKDAHKRRDLAKIKYFLYLHCLLRIMQTKHVYTNLRANGSKTTFSDQLRDFCLQNLGSYLYWPSSLSGRSKNKEPIAPRPLVFSILKKAERERERDKKEERNAYELYDLQLQFSWSRG